MLPFAGHADERKQLVFDAVERNAAQMTLLSDSIQIRYRVEEDAVFLAAAGGCATAARLNRAEMEKYRPEMRRFYLNKTVRFQ